MKVAAFYAVVIAGCLALSGADADHSPPVAWLPVPGVPVIVQVPPPVMGGAQADWVGWGWRMYPTTDRVTTATDG